MRSQSQGPYTLMQIGAIIFVAALLLMAVGTFLNGSLRLLRPATESTGRITAVGLSEDGVPGLTFIQESDEFGEEVLFLRLRNNGRIMRLLRSAPPAGPVLIEQQGGQVVGLQGLNDDPPLVREHRTPPLLAIAVSALAVAVAVPLGMPLLRDWRRSAEATSSKTAATTREEE